MALLLIQLPAHVPENVVEAGPCPQAPVIHKGDQAGIPGFWFEPDLAAIVADNWGMNH